MAQLMYLALPHPQYSPRHTPAIREKGITAP